MVSYSSPYAFLNDAVPTLNSLRSHQTQQVQGRRPVQGLGLLSPAVSRSGSFAGGVFWGPGFLNNADAPASAMEICKPSTAFAAHLCAHGFEEV